MYSCHLFFIFSPSVRSILFLFFIVPIFAWNIPLVSLIFLERPLVFPILLFSSISLHWSLRKVSYLSLLFFETLFFEFRWVYLSFSPLSSASLLFSAIVRPPQTNHFALLHFFFLGMVLITTSCTRLQTFVHSSSVTLFIKSNPLNLFCQQQTKRGPLEMGMANHFSILALRTPWTVWKAKRYDTERWTPQVGRCPICYWRRVDK